MLQSNRIEGGLKSESCNIHNNTDLQQSL